MKSLAVIFVCLFLFACETTSEEPIVVPQKTSPVKTGGYTIGVGDQLSISVWRNPDISVAVPVRPDGMISVPLIGDIQAAEQEPVKLAGEIKGKLSNFIKNPQVTVVVTDAVSSAFLHRVRVTGAVNQPASLPYNKGMTVMDLVLVSGGLTDFANANATKLYRVSSAGTKIYEIKLDDILGKGDIQTNFLLQPGDIVTVPERLF
ncbi:sugar ABC transporter substrate-binding protein [Ketobacter sp. MCCC 1A13808]|uniref:XrtA/PEP-CTERM system exopolysaccharide export protein n=1 Tax=Ketobacter sp. MCCC 1A13808 TaxID=2602738 RepID=UPI000F1D859B|nr:XrtA/PEP-CTERM system exopolysaccharide export protein [Ketobacter sp. MCCC 1A13808]MVF10547.1 sugar ABC transporter substrate-binding protein [Ketobacter sp. MCCC 1A13808]RLP55975.1 MAG: sugar ABC transporter substrate-binding protein [Ketobacter sp.]